MAIAEWRARRRRAGRRGANAARLIERASETPAPAQPQSGIFEVIDEEGKEYTAQEAGGQLQDKVLLVRSVPEEEQQARDQALAQFESRYNLRADRSQTREEFAKNQEEAKLPPAYRTPDYPAGAKEVYVSKATGNLVDPALGKLTEGQLSQKAYLISKSTEIKTEPVISESKSKSHIREFGEGAIELGKDLIGFGYSSAIGAGKYVSEVDPQIGAIKDFILSKQDKIDKNLLDVRGGKAGLIFDPDVQNAGITTGLIVGGPTVGKLASGAFVGLEAFSLVKNPTPRQAGRTALAALIVTGPKLIELGKSAYVKTGSKFIDPADVFAESVISGKERLPSSKGTFEALERFRATETDLGTYRVSTASPKAIEGNLAGVGKKASLGYEDPGIYVTPAGEGSPYFLRTGKGGLTEYTLNPFKGLRDVPTVTEFDVQGIRTYPAKVLKEPGFEGVGRYQKTMAGSGEAFITKRSMLGQGELKPQKFFNEARGKFEFEIGTNELEAVIPKGAQFEYTPKTLAGKIKGFDQYTVWDGQPVAIRKAALLTEGPLGPAGMPDLLSDALSGKRRISSSVLSSEMSRPSTQYRPLVPPVISNPMKGSLSDDGGMSSYEIISQPKMSSSRPSPSRKTYRAVLSESSPLSEVSSRSMLSEMSPARQSKPRRTAKSRVSFISEALSTSPISETPKYSPKSRPSFSRPSPSRPSSSSPISRSLGSAGRYTANPSTAPFPAPTDFRFDMNFPELEKKTAKGGKPFRQKTEYLPDLPSSVLGIEGPMPKEITPFTPRPLKRSKKKRGSEWDFL